MPKKRKRFRSLQASAGRCTITANSDGVPRFNGVAYTGGVMYPRQAPDGCVVDLAGMKQELPQLPAAREHNPDNICGQSTAVKNNGRVLTCSGILAGNDQTVLSIAKAAKAAGQEASFPLSIDLSFHEDNIQWLEAGERAIVNGQKFTGPLPIVRRSLLRRIDFVSKGGDPRAFARITASAGGDPMTFEQWLAKLGFADKASVSAEQLPLLQAKYDAEMAADAAADDAMGGEDESSSGLSAADGGDEDDLEQIADDATDTILRRGRRTLAAEAARTSAIRRLCQKHGFPDVKVKGNVVSLEAHAVEMGWDLNRTELEILRNGREKAPAGQVRQLQASADALVAAQLMDLRIDVERTHSRQIQLEAGAGVANFLFQDINSDAKQRILEAAHHLRGLSSMDFAATALEATGQYVPRGARGVLQSLEAAGSTASLSNVIATTAKSAIVISFEQTPDSTQEWCEEDFGKNFLNNNVVGMKQPGGSLDLLDNGTATEDHLSDKGEQIKINRFGKQFNVDEQTLINDELGVVMKTMAGAGGWGQKAKNTRPDLVYSLILANGNMSDGVAFFHAATHRNLQTGSALTNTTLGTAINMLQIAYETGADGEIALLTVEPTHVLVPPLLAHNAIGQIESENLGAIAASQVPTKNPIADYNLKRVTEGRLQLGMKHKLTKAALSGSDSTWFVISANAPPVLVRYLQASGRMPSIRTTPLTMGRWGVNIDCKFDIGACLQRFQTMVKSTA